MDRSLYIIKQRLEKILSELNISVEGLCCLKNHKIKNLTSPDKNYDLNIRHGKSKILEYLTEWYETIIKNLELL